MPALDPSPARALNDRVAIVGRGGLFPGCRSLDEFWDHIRNGRDRAREVPPGRWVLPAEQAHDPRMPAPDKVYATRGCFLDDEVLHAPLDESLIIDRAVLKDLDPLYRLVLHAGAMAWRDFAAGDAARLDGVDLTRAGVLLGNIALPTQSASALARDILGRTFEEKLLRPAGVPGAPAAATTHALNRFVAGLPAGLLARALGLGGGASALDAACASSLYAVKLAADELLAHRADVMLAGGLSRPDVLYTQMGFSQLRALSPKGRCAPFDEHGDGLLVGEGAGLFVLKRLSDALRGGDRIYATIAGAGLSNDVGGSLLAPDSEGQLRALRAAYRGAGWTPDEVDLIECHATGTPVGDAVEFHSLSKLWRDDAAERTRERKCVIGSVKSNVGHLLTGAGAAGLMKVLLALEHETLPPTAHFQRAGGKVDLEASPFEVLAQARPWPARYDGGPRRAAVSAFGFGGINAHLLIEDWPAQPPATEPVQVIASAPAKAEPIAIVGLGARFGPWEDRHAVTERLLGVGDTPPQPPTRWWGVEQSAVLAEYGLTREQLRGHFIERVRVPRDRFRIPPRELEEMLPQQLLMLLAADEALRDAGHFDKDGVKLKALGPRAGLFIGIELDLNTTNFQLRWSLPEQAARWAQALELTLDETQREAWHERLRDAYGPALSANRTMGALGGIVASRLAREFRCGGPSFTVSGEEASGLLGLERGVRALQSGALDTALVGAVDLAGDVRHVLAAQRLDGGPRIAGEGAAAFVLKRLADAERDGDRIYAVLDGLGAATHDAPKDAARAAMGRALHEASTTADRLGLLATDHGLSGPAAQASPLNLIGHAGAACGAATLLQAVWALYQDLLPAGKNRPAQYWLRNRADGPRRAGVISRSRGAQSVCAILRQYEPAAASTHREPERRQPLGTREEALFLVAAEDETALRAALADLTHLARAHNGAPVEALARKWFAKHPAVPQPWSAALVARSSAQLADLIDLAEVALKADAEPSLPPTARDRVFVRRGEPLDDTARTLAFVFPGSGNQYPGMGCELAAHWPDLLRRQDAENERLAEQFQPEAVWNGARAPGPQDLLMAQVTLGTLTADWLRALNVGPRFVLGCSLGESASFFGMRIWTARDEMLCRLRTSDLFENQLAAPYRAVQQAWGVPDDAPVDWTVGVVNRSPEAILEALRAFDKAYLLIVNTPGECVVGGAQDQIEALAEKLGARMLRVSGVTVAHSDVVQPVADSYRAFHHFPVHENPDLTFFSGAHATPVTQTSDGCADTVLAQALHTVNMPRAVEAAYAAGARVFVEMGPGASCTRMIRKILKGRPHRAVALTQTSQRETFTALSALAALLTEGIPANLHALYGGDSLCTGHRAVTHGDDAGRDLEVPVGGAPFAVPPTPERATPPAAATTRPSRAEMAPAVPDVSAAPSKPALASSPAPIKVATAAPPQPAPAPQPTHALLERFTATEQAKLDAHAAYLTLSGQLTAALAQTAGLQIALAQRMPGDAPAPLAASVPTPAVVAAPPPKPAPKQVALDRAQCMDFAVGSVGRVLGEQFAAIDAYPTRVRLPDEPLMLVDRILEIEGEPLSMSHGRVVTEHDIYPGAWYLDGGRIPTCIAVEAGQADLFLSGYLGIDLQTKGLAVYRLLDAVVTFHRALPVAGETIHYDIRILHFFRQGNTYLFRFEFDSTVNGEKLLTMRDGCAGFFTQSELDAGQGIVHTALDKRPIPGKTPEGWRAPAPAIDPAGERYDAAQVEALRRGDLAACFGPAFAALPLRAPMRLPSGRMTLVDRVERIDPSGGRYGLGQIRAEMDIAPDDWFLTCHFSDDMVMPGTLMYECCMHTLRILLMRMGWVAEHDGTVCEPLPGVRSTLKCRGQVIASTKMVTYEVNLKEIGFGPEPYVIADALMYADGKPIVEIIDMSLRMSGATREGIEALWASDTPAVEAAGERKPALYDTERITAFAIGKPSDAFGAPYRVFDDERVIARLPGPPYQFLDRITAISAEPWKMEAGGVIEAQYDVPPDAWYFEQHPGQGMPFAVLLEVALQPCGWLAAYMGSALTSETDLSFRNLGGHGEQFLAVEPDSGTLTTTVKSTKVSTSGGMIIQHYDLDVRDRRGVVYRGDTYFGFFSKQALANQIGIRDAKVHVPSEAERAAGTAYLYPAQPPYPGPMLRMLDRIDLFAPDGGPAGQGLICGSLDVKPESWFFKAHFHQDPVCPGSLGLESFLQLLAVAARGRWGASTRVRAMALNTAHRWTYRGQVIPVDKTVRVQAEIVAWDDAQKRVRAHGHLEVDGRLIYQMHDFEVQAFD